MCLSSVCEMRENNSERSLNLAHFDTELIALMSPVVKCQCCQNFIEKNKDKHKKHWTTHILYVL